jgi:hypothetical protein
MSNKDEINENRRRINKLTGAGILTVLTGGTVGTAAYLDAANKPEQQEGGGAATPEPQGYSPGELNEWDSIEKCLSTEQEESVTEVVERYESLSRNDLRYSIETDGNVIVHEPAEDGYRPIAETTDNDFMCEIDY